MIAAVKQVEGGWKLLAGGADIWEKADQFQFVLNRIIAWSAGIYTRAYVNRLSSANTPDPDMPRRCTRLSFKRKTPQELGLAPKSRRTRKSLEKVRVASQFLNGVTILDKGEKPRSPIFHPSLVDVTGKELRLRISSTLALLMPNVIPPVQQKSFLVSFVYGMSSGWSVHVPRES